MDAALEIFREKGVGPTTIEQITAGAGVAKGTFYLHFSSKEDVLGALRERFVRDLLQGIETAVSRCAQGDWPGRLEAWVRAAVEGYLDALQLHDIVFHESPPPYSREKHSSNELVTHLTALLEGGVAAGAWRVENPHVAAVFLFHGFHGMVDDALATHKRVNRSRLVRSVASLFCAALGAARVSG